MVRHAQTLRMEKLRRALAAAGLGGAVVAPGPNMRYLTGVDSLMLERPFLLLVPAEGDPALAAPRLEAGPYSLSPVKITVHPWTDSEGPGGAMAQAAASAGVEGLWGVEGRVPYGYLSTLLNNARMTPKDCEPILQGLRERKDAEEVRLLRRSASILGAAFESVPAILRAGKTEFEIAREFTDAIHAEGATKVDDVLVQSGPRGADPHSLPSPRKVARGESVVVDVGASYEGYYADITRTFCLGANPGVEKVYDAVLSAEEAGIRASREGVETGAVDSAARKAMAGAGLAKEFFHRTGHGLGLEIHEAPYIVEGGRARLREGMCFTVEPGAYLKGRFGVRIEDDVLVAGRKGEAITSPPKEYGWWK